MTKATQGEKLLYDLITEHLDESEYDGGRCARCLIGMPARALGSPIGSDSTKFMAELTGAPAFSVNLIFDLACVQPFRRDVQAAKKMARQILRIEPLSDLEIYYCLIACELRTDYWDIQSGLIAHLPYTYYPHVFVELLEQCGPPRRVGF